MDIEYLLWLQGIREAAGPVVETIMNVITELGSGVVLALVPCLVYWIVDKRLGQYLLVNIAIGNNINSTVKDIACVYRPWIRDARIIPSESALENATGYSFPSGHTQGAASTFGAIAYKLRERRAVCVLLTLLVLLIAFSRNYLGVHTPQDVLVALAIGALSIGLSNLFIAWVGKDGVRDTTVLAVCLAVVAALALFTALKPYPMDYVDGELLVDPDRMRLDAYSNLAIGGGVALGWFLEKRYVRFSTDCSTKRKVVRLIVCIVLVASFMGLAQLIKFALGRGVAYAVARGLFPAFIGSFAGPAVSARLEDRFAPSDTESSRESQ